MNAIFGIWIKMKKKREEKRREGEGRGGKILQLLSLGYKNTTLGFLGKIVICLEFRNRKI